MVKNIILILVVALAIAIAVIAGLIYFYSPFTSGGGTISLKLGPGGCIDEASCRKYCEKNLQDCIEWCTENEHVLCGIITREYLGQIK